MMRRVSLTVPVLSLHNLLVQKPVIDESVWLLTAGEAEEEEEKGAEEEADGQPVKRPAEEEVGSGFRCISQHFHHPYLI